MANVVEATEDGPGLFNALSIALGIEILSGRLDSQKESPGYNNLLDEFEKHHPEFKPKSWDNLKKWLAFYNASKDMELLLAPVLFQLNQQYQDLLDDQIQDELFQLIWANRVQIESEVPWWQLIMNDDAGNILFPRLDNLESGSKVDLIRQLKTIIQIILSQCNENSTGEDVKRLLKQNSTELVQGLKAQILANKMAYLGVYRCRELESMANALNISVIEEGTEKSSANKTIIRLQKKQYHWNVVCGEDDFHLLINQFPSKLKITSHEAFQRKGTVAGPTQQEIDLLNEPRTLLKEQLIDNPGLGNCAFYAFAIALIHIIQKESASKDQNNKAMYEHWVSLDKTIADEFDAICAFDFLQRDKKLLDKLQSSLRQIAYNYQLAELKQACAKATVADELDKEHPDKDSLAYKNAMKYKYKDITANTNYINFAALYFGNTTDIDPRFNPFAKSNTIDNELNKLDPSKIEVNFEELTLVPLFLKLIYGDEQADKPVTPITEPGTGSSIIEGMKNILKQFFWGLHQDLSDLAAQFKVNLHTLENGINLRDEKRGDISNQHTVTVNNVGNFHWTTQITMVKKSQGFYFDKPEGLALSKKNKTISSGHLSDSVKNNEKENQSKKEEVVTDVLKSHADLMPTAPKNSGIEMSGNQDEASKKTQDEGQRVRFTFTQSQLELQELRKRNLELLNRKNTQIPETPAELAHKEKLLRLRRAVSNATIAYTEYSDSIWFSIFHRHGNTGRVRAKAFNNSFSEIDNYNDAKEQLVSYLSNNKNNGNTHPHSFRTMLLHEMLKDNPKPTLQYTSAHFEDMLAELSSVLNVRLPNTPMHQM